MSWLIEVFQTVNALSWFKMHSNPEVWHSKKKNSLSITAAHITVRSLFYLGGTSFT